MALDVIRKSDVPPGPVRQPPLSPKNPAKHVIDVSGPLQFHKDYDRCLITEDLDRAQPLLSHPTTDTGAPIPWKYIQKPPLVPGHTI